MVVLKRRDSTVTQKYINAFFEIRIEFLNYAFDVFRSIRNFQKLNLRYYLRLPCVVTDQHVRLPIRSVRSLISLCSDRSSLCGDRSACAVTDQDCAVTD